MASQVEICNFALSRLGAKTITSLEDGTTEANLCSAMFDILAKEVMAAGSWSSTIARIELASTGSTPSFEFSYTFQLPVDPLCLKVLAVNEGAPGVIQYAIEQDKLLTDESSIKIKYVSYLTSTDDWDTLLTRAFIARLASELAYPITGSDSKAQVEYQRYERFLQDGLALDGQQGSSQVSYSTDLTEVR